MEFFVSVDWSTWLVGVEADTERHWSRNQKIYIVYIYVGPFALGIEWPGKDYSIYN